MVRRKECVRRKMRRRRLALRAPARHFSDNQVLDQDHESQAVRVKDVITQAVGGSSALAPPTTHVTYLSPKRWSAD